MPEKSIFNPRDNLIGEPGLRVSASQLLFPYIFDREAPENLKRLLESGFETDFRKSEAHSFGDLLYHTFTGWPEHLANGEESEYLVMVERFQKNAVPALRRVLNESQHPGARFQAARYAWKVGPTAIDLIPDLDQRFRDGTEHPDTIGYALGALSQIHSKSRKPEFSSTLMRLDELFDIAGNPGRLEANLVLARETLKSVGSNGQYMQ